MIPSITLSKKEIKTIKQAFDGPDCLRWENFHRIPADMNTQLKAEYPYSDKSQFYIESDNITLRYSSHTDWWHAGVGKMEKFQ
jgi:hypothetical protein